MADTSSPFTAQDLASINTALLSLINATKLLEKAAAAGFDVSALSSDCQSCMTTLEGIKREFYTVKPGS